MAESKLDVEIRPRLVLDRVDDAVALYREVFDADLFERFVDDAGVVVHAAVRIGNSVVTMAQEVREWGLLAPTTVGGSSVLLHLTLPDPDKARDRLVERGGAVIVPIEDRPYGLREGRVRDPFGHLWILSRPVES